MKYIRQLCAGILLVLALSLPALAGEMGQPRATNGTPETPGIAGDVQYPGITGEMQYDVAGEMQQPIAVGEISCPSIMGEIECPGISLIFAILF